MILNKFIIETSPFQEGWNYCLQHGETDKRFSKYKPGSSEDKLWFAGYNLCKKLKKQK